MKILFTLLFGLIFFNGQAQRISQPGFLGTHADSVATLRRVFRLNRRLARIGTFTAAPSVGFGIDELTYPSSTARQVISCYVIGIYTAYLVHGAMNWRRYSKRSEEEAVRRFEQHQPQPIYLQRRIVAAFSH